MSHCLLIFSISENKLNIFQQLFRFLPWFDYTIRQAIIENGITFNSDQYVSCFHQPILFLHAVDDRTVPLELGYKVYYKQVIYTIQHTFQCNLKLLFILFLYISCLELLDVVETSHGDLLNFIGMLLPKILGIDIYLRTMIHISQ